MKLKKYEKNPIIAPNPANAWENLVTCNPGVIYDDGRFYMLYRAAGDDKEHVIRLGLAVSENGFDFRRVGDSPVFGPSADGPDGGCVEDPRIVKFDNEFYITYAYRAHAPGQYWTFAHDVVRLPRCGAYAPAAMAQNLGNTGLAVTTDFRNFRRLGRLTSPVLDDRDVILFPEKIGGKFAMMHRPKQFVGERYGVKYPSIWLKFSDDLLAWEDKPSHLLIAGREGTWEEKIGGSTPPILTEAGTSTRRACPASQAENSTAAASAGVRNLFIINRFVRSVKSSTLRAYRTPRRSGNQSAGRWRRATACGRPPCASAPRRSDSGLPA